MNGDDATSDGYYDASVVAPRGIASENGNVNVSGTDDRMEAKRVEE